MRLPRLGKVVVRGAAVAVMLTVSVCVAEAMADEGNTAAQWLQDGRQTAAKDLPVAPDRVVPLFNGRDLRGWTTWLVDTKRRDPRGVYTVRDGMIRVSGDGFGYLSTDREYKDYRLVVEVKWGTQTWRTRKDMARDSGIFLHSVGPDGGSYDCGWRASRRNEGSDISNGAYKAAIECQVMEGEFGGILLIDGRYADGRNVPMRLDARVTRDRDAKGNAPTRFDATGKLETFRRGWIHWSDRDPSWRDVFGFRGRSDIESLADKWSRIECLCAGDRITVFVNGTRVNEAHNVFPSAGKILLQCEGSEVYFRKVELHPLAKGQRAQHKPRNCGGSRRQECLRSLFHG